MLLILFRLFGKNEIVMSDEIINIIGNIVGNMLCFNFLTRF